MCSGMKKLGKRQFLPLVLHFGLQRCKYGTASD